MPPAAEFPRFSWTSRTIENCENPATWGRIYPTGATITLESCAGVQNNGLRIRYDLTGENWVIANRPFTTPLNLSGDDFLGLWYRGTPATGEHRLEIKVKDSNDEFIVHIPRVAHVPVYVHVYIDHRLFNDQDVNNGDGILNWADIREVLIAISRGDPKDYSRQPVDYAGTLDIDLITSSNSRARSMPAGFEQISGDPAVASAAAGWVANRQDPSTSLVPSWEGDWAPLAYLYDEALALLVLMHTHPQKAADLAGRLVQLQLADGSWHRRYNSATGAVVAMDDLDAEYWVGDIAWAVFALARYAAHARDIASARSAIKGAEYLTTRLEPFCGGKSIHWVTEGNIDTWWAFHATGSDAEAASVWAYLQGCVWEPNQQRWLGGRSGGHWISLDCQTWGSPVLVALGEPSKALAALGFAAEGMRTWDFRHVVEAFDGQGPFSVWHEGTAQYVCARGPGAQWILDHVLNPAQKLSGGMPGTPALPANLPDSQAWSGDGVWLTTWSGVAPTSWLYFANTDTPFARGPFVSGRADFDRDADVDEDDLTVFVSCIGPAAVPAGPLCANRDLDGDHDVDQDDFGAFQRCYNGKDRWADPGCLH